MRFADFYTYVAIAGRSKQTLEPSMLTLERSVNNPNVFLHNFELGNQ